METYFSVGEISKLTNVPIQTLIYYDKMGLLKPAYINEQNNYFCLIMYIINTVVY